jgi:hypothetical protein
VVLQEDFSMFRKFLVLLSAGAALVAVSATASSASSAHSDAGPARGIELAHGHDGHSAGGGGNHHSPNMTYHGGVIMTTANIHPIFWGTSWPSYVGDKITGMDSFYAGWNNSNYAKTNTEYTGSNGRAGATSTSAASKVDGTAAQNPGSGTSIIFNEVSSAISRGLVPLDTSGNGYYPVYTDIPRGNAGFCAWHSSGSVNGQRVQFAFFFKLDGDAGCDPQDSTTGHSQGLAAIANVSGHELSEAITDPASPGAWYDGQGQENGDKCAWTFNVASVTFSNGTHWKVQGEWSNAAYTAGTGYPNRSGQKGCLDGH